MQHNSEDKVSGFEYKKTEMWLQLQIQKTEYKRIQAAWLFISLLHCPPSFTQPPVMTAKRCLFLFCRHQNPPFSLLGPHLSHLSDQCWDKAGKEKVSKLYKYVALHQFCTEEPKVSKKYSRCLKNITSRRTTCKTIWTRANCSRKVREIEPWSLIPATHYQRGEGVGETNFTDVMQWDWNVYLILHRVL